MLNTLHKFYKSDFVTKFLITLFFIALSLGQLQKIPVLFDGKIFVHDLIAVAFIVWEVISKPKLITQLVRKFMSTSLLVKCFVCWVGISLVINFVLNQITLLPSFLYLGRLVLYFVCVLLLSRYRQLTEKGVMWWGIGLTFFGFLQYIFLPDTRFLFFLGWDDHYYRLISTLLDPGFTGLLLVLFFWFIQSKNDLLHILYGHLLKVQPIVRQSARVILSVAVLLALALTYSRAAYLAFGITSVLFMVFEMFKWKGKESGKVGKALSFAFYLFAFIACIPFLPRPGGEGVNLARTSTITARTENIRVITHSVHGWDWLYGIGLFVPRAPSPNPYQLVNHAQIADNWIVFLLSGSGLVGLILFCGVLWQVGRELYQKDLYLLLMFISIMIHGLFSASIVYPFAVLFFGCSWVALETEKKRKATH
jgi:hypothetical protein